MIRPVDFLLDFLKAEQARGTTHVHLDEDARDALRELFQQSKGKLPTAPTSVPAPASAPAPAVSARPAMDIAPAPLPTPAPAVPTSVSVVGQSPAEQLASLPLQAEKWPAAQNITSLHKIMVFASGDPTAAIMLVTDAPGYHEERELKPFAGPSGEKLDAILKAMGLSREQVYISNLVKFRPAAPKQATSNRQCTPEELAAFLPILHAEINIIRPQCIIALGETAAQGLLGIPAPAKLMQGTWQQFHGTPVRVTHSVGRLLQTSAGHLVKRQLWEDMLTVMEKIAMPVSEKQRGFFLTKP